PDAHQDAFQIDATSGGVRHGIVSNNQISNGSGQGLFIARSAHNQSYAIDSVTIANNSITGSFGASAFQVEGSNLTITGNTVSATSPFVSDLLETASNVTFTGNTFTGQFINCATA